MQPQQPNQDRSNSEKMNQDKNWNQDRKSTNQEDSKANSPSRKPADNDSSESRRASNEGSGTPNEFPEFQNQPTPNSDVQLRDKVDRKSQFKAPEDTI